MKKHCHVVAVPSAEYCGIMLVNVDGNDCCSCLEGKIVDTDGNFDAEEAIHTAYRITERLNVDPMALDFA